MNDRLTSIFQLDPVSTAMAGEHIQQQCHGNSVASGWWQDPLTGLDLKSPSVMKAQNLVPLKLVLVHSELSEGLEGYRKNLMDDHLPHRPMLEVELADAVIRIFDLAGALNYDLGGAISEKLSYNSSRADHKPENRAKSGGKEF